MTSSVQYTVFIAQYSAICAHAPYRGRPAPLPRARHWPAHVHPTMAG